MSLFLGYITVIIGLVVIHLITGSGYTREDGIFYLVLTGAASATACWYELRDRARR